jgi:class 3 adenylate cyclase
MLDIAIVPEPSAVLFTDLVDSTLMYSKAGDAAAFRIVEEHVSRVRRIAEARQGAVVKTLGDSVMAVFRSPARCLEAALEMDTAVRDLAPGGVPLRVRAGFAFGPCIALRTPGSTDYFGTTVNLAARLEARARSGEVTMPASVASRDDVRGVLRAWGRSTSHVTIYARGFESSIDVVRVLENPNRTAIGAVVAIPRPWIPKSA